MSNRFVLAFMSCMGIGVDAHAATLPSTDFEKDIPSIGEGVRDLGNGYVGVGDLILKPEEVGTRAAVKRQWPGGRLIYQFDASVSQAEQASFLSACAAWSNGTPVTCQQRNGEADYVLVRTHAGDGCGPVTSCSAVGRKGGVQPFNILVNADYNHWRSQETVQHELGHAFGLIHEHNRRDRDSYVFVREGNVAEDYRNDVLTKDETAVPVSDYDYLSIMHYGNCGGSNNRGACNMNRRDLWTLEPKPCGLDRVGGSVISALDRDGMRKAYASFLMAEIGAERQASCGTLSYGTDVIPAGAAPKKEFLKVETVSKKDCGAFVSKDWGKGMCNPIRKTEMSLDIDADPLSCFRDGLLTTRHEATATCGCEIASFQASCVRGTAASLKAYVPPKRTPDEWRLGRIRHFNDVMRDLRDAAVLTEAVASSLPDFYFLNAADQRLESKLFRLRHRLYSYATWKKKIDTSFQVDAVQFAKFAQGARLRIN